MTPLSYNFLGFDNDLFLRGRLIADLSCADPGKWGNAPLTGVSLRRALYRTIHNGLASHSHIIIEDGKSTLVIDLELTPQRAIAYPAIGKSLAMDLASPVPDYDGALQLVPLPFVPPTPLREFPARTTTTSTDRVHDFDHHTAALGLTKTVATSKAVLQATQRSESTAMTHIMSSAPRINFLAASRPAAILRVHCTTLARGDPRMYADPDRPLPLWREEVSRRFEANRRLSFRELILDGTHCMISPREVLMFDAASDTELALTVDAVRNLLRTYVGADKRAMVLAKFVAEKLGGSAPDLPVKTELLLNALRTQAERAVAAPLTKSDASSNTRLVVLRFGELIRRSGVERHRALLFKYLADRTQQHPELFSASRACPEPIRALVAIPLPPPEAANAGATAAFVAAPPVTTLVMVGLERYSVDFASDPPKFAPATAGPTVMRAT